MSLAAGTRLGPYEVLAPIGAGGMGEVYRGKDTRLDRTVAIKVLPEDLAADGERRARFEREARTIATLNHPHICTLHDVGEQDGRAYLVMEHLVGETLADRLTQGPLALDQALEIGAQVADALGAAHRHGIVHRDLKPANVMLTRGGAAQQGAPQAKLLDFGLAKLRPQEGVRLVSAAPTRTRDVTSVGTLVGTLPYMAPEQIEGREADARTDLWALGCLLYEMVTGQRAFEGATSGSLVGAIMAKEPAPLAAVQPVTPPALERLVRRCLAKDPEQRWDSAHDAAYELRWIAQAHEEAVVARVEPRRPRWQRLALLVAGGLAMAGAGAGVMWQLRPAPPRARLTRVSLDLSPAEGLPGSSSSIPTPGGPRTALAWTPDGQALVFVGRRADVPRQLLYVRRMDAGEAQPIAGTEGAQVPAVSPDGQWVAFFQGGAIKRVPLGGGPVVDLASGLSMLPQGIAYDDGGRVFFAKQYVGSIWVIPPDGAPTAVTTVGEGEIAHTLPWPLPGGRALYTVRKRLTSWGDEEVVTHTLATGARKVLLKDAADARYLPTGHLVFLRRGVLFAVPFDVEALEVRGAPVAVLDTVAQSLTAAGDAWVSGAGQFAVSATGTLAWVSSPVIPYPDGTLVAVDRRGQVTPLPAPVRSYFDTVRVSPDGRRLAVPIQTLSEVGLWVYDLDRGTLSPLNRDGEATYAVWSPDARRLVFGWLANGRPALAEQPADGTTPPRVLVPSDLVPVSFTPDGQQVTAVRVSSGNSDIVRVSVANGQASVQPLIETPAREESPEISPDGRWLAYRSNVSGRGEIYVRPYPGPGPAEQLSLEGGWSPAWGPGGHELFFVKCEASFVDCRLMAVEFTPGSPPRLGRPRALFTYNDTKTKFLLGGSRGYDVAPDGERFYAVQRPPPPPAPAVTHINLLQNWFEELKAKVPVGAVR